MAQWQTVEAKQRFSSLVEAAATRGPQVVMRHKEPVAVVMSADDYRRLAREAAGNWGRLLAESPFEKNELAGLGMSLGDDA